MFINEFGSRDYPTVILLAPMMVSGTDLYHLMQPFFPGDYHFIAPDQGGHGNAKGYISPQEEYQTLRLSTALPWVWQSAIVCFTTLRFTLLMPGSMA